MSFRDSFTRNSGSSENLQYDDTASYHFLTTILLLLFVPLLWTILRTLLDPFRHMPKLKEIEARPQFKKKISKFKQQNKYKFITCWFVIKILLAVVIAFGLAQCYFVLKEKGDNIKSFDPYEILEVEEDAPIQKIKKSYRKLALIYHPDRNKDDPEASAKFILISRAYQCLTDEKGKQNCLKYGNPQGVVSTNVGIALPSFLIKKQNQVVIMGVVFVLVVIVLPIFLIYYFAEVNKFDEFGMLQESHNYVNGMIHQQLSIKDCVKCLAVCQQFKDLKTTKPQVLLLEQLLKQSEQDFTKFFMKKNFLNYIKKAIILIDARVSEKKIPNELTDDLRYIMKKVPILTKAIVMLGYGRSNEMIIRYRPDLFVGGNALGSLIMFGQYFIQGKSDLAQQFQQLDLTDDQIEKIIKKKKKRILSIAQLQTVEQERTFFLSNLAPQRTKYIQQMIQYFPRITEVQIIAHAAGDKEITTNDIVQIMIDIKSNRQSSFCNAVRYPFLKMQGWWLMVLDRNYVIHLEHFSFGKDPVFNTKFSRGMYQKSGNYSLTVKIFSDCYYGFEAEKTLKFTVGSPKKQKQEVKTVDDEEDSLDKEQTFFDKIMKSVMPQKEEELSDREDEPEDNKSKKTKQVQEKTETEEGMKK